jgi:ribokinase
MVERAVLPLVDALTTNRREAMALAGVEGQGDAAVQAAACALARQGPRIVCIKLDDGGCLLRYEGRSWRLKAAPVELVDSTGAGDAFTGAFAVALLEGQRVEQGAAFAVAASEVAVTAFGAQPAYPTCERLQRQLQAIDRRPVPWEA